MLCTSRTALTLDQSPKFVELFKSPPLLPTVDLKVS